MDNDKRIPFFWVAVYEDGTILPQFDVATGQQHLFKEVNQSKLVKFGWFPISMDLVSKLPMEYYHNKNLPFFLLSLEKNQKIIAHRTESQQFYTYSQCTKCGFKFQWMPNQPDNSIGDSGLPRFGSKKYYYEEMQNNGKPAYEVICPKCGTFNDLKCPKCKEWWNKVTDVETEKLPKEQWKYHLECPKCKDVYKRKVLSLSGYRIICEWILGYEEQLQFGETIKHLMSIDKDGVIKLVD